MTTNFFVALLAVIGLVLLGLSWKFRQVPVCLAASLPWLAIGIGLITDSIPGLSIADPMVTVMGFMCLLLIFVALMPSIIRSTQITKTNKQGESYTMWAKPTTEPTVRRGRQVYLNRREEMRNSIRKHR